MDRNEKQNSLKNIRITRDSVRQNKKKPKGRLVKGLAALVLLAALGFGGFQIYRHSPFYDGQDPEEAVTESGKEGEVQLKALVSPEPESEPETSDKAESVTETPAEAESVTETPAEPESAVETPVEAESLRQDEIPQETVTEAAAESVSDAGPVVLEQESPEIMESKTEETKPETTEEGQMETTTEGSSASVSEVSAADLASTDESKGINYIKKVSTKGLRKTNREAEALYEEFPDDENYKGIHDMRITINLKKNSYEILKMAFNQHDQQNPE